MATETDSIEREIERTRDQLATTLDELATRANPKRLLESTRRTVGAKLAEPKVRYALIGTGVLVAGLVVRSLFR